MSEETTESNIRWSSSEDNRPGPSQPPPQGWPYTTDGQLGLPTTEWPVYQRRKRSTNPQQDENFIAALEAVRTGGLGFCKAAKIYGVNNRTLWKNVKCPSNKQSVYSGLVVEPLTTPSMGSKRGRLLMRQHRIKKESEILHTEGENEPPRIERQCSEPSPNLLTVPQQSYLTKQNSSPHLTTVSTCTTSTENQPQLKVKVEEFRRTISTPQCSNEPCEAARACHCPVLRPGPALGCNFCWNTIDGHGRILRRKTKYHCPECQTNLCIVPCFQEYHERQGNSGSIITRDVTPTDQLQSGSSLTTIMKTSSL